MIDCMECQPSDCVYPRCTDRTPPETETVKRADLFGNITDSHQTEAELNGWRESQGTLFATDGLQSPWRRPPHPTDKFQGRML